MYFQLVYRASSRLFTLKRIHVGFRSDRIISKPPHPSVSLSFLSTRLSLPSAVASLRTDVVFSLNCRDKPLSSYSISCSFGFDDVDHTILTYLLAYSTICLISSRSLILLFTGATFICLAAHGFSPPTRRLPPSPSTAAFFKFRLAGSWHLSLTCNKPSCCLSVRIVDYHDNVCRRQANSTSAENQLKLAVFVATLINVPNGVCHGERLVAFSWMTTNSKLSVWLSRLQLGPRSENRLLVCSTQRHGMLPQCFALDFELTLQQHSNKLVGV